MESKCRVRQFLHVLRYAASYVRLLHRGAPMKYIRLGTLLACLGIAAASFCALVLSGCVGATRLPARTNGPAGTTIQKNDIDLAFLQSGTTRREEVVNKLNRIDTGYSSPGMFWGRWSESNWGHWVILAVPGGAGGDAGRNWHVHNLLVSFDENGVMQTKELIDGEKDLESELRVQLVKAPALDLSQPLLVKLTPLVTAEGNPMYGLVEMTITKEGMQVRDTGQTTFSEISPLDVARISYERFYGKPSSDSICHSLHLSEKTHGRKKILFCASAANLATVIKYLQQAGPPNMRWE